MGRRRRRRRRRLLLLLLLMPLRLLAIACLCRDHRVLKKTNFAVRYNMKIAQNAAISRPRASLAANLARFASSTALWKRRNVRREPSGCLAWVQIVGFVGCFTALPRSLQSVASFPWRPASLLDLINKSGRARNSSYPLCHDDGPLFASVLVLRRLA